ncbi:MAG: thiolase family protein [Rectinemataceae bacterium]|nr:thiolase family protein [Rectinemataceae bacterium]
MREAFIVSVARSPVGKRGQALASFEAPVLAAMAMRKAVDRAGLNPVSIDEVIFGNLFNFNYGNLARVAVLKAGFPISVPAITIDRQCSSSLNAGALGASLIMSGACDTVLCGGVESYSKMPLMIKRPESGFPAELEFTSLSVSTQEVGDPSMIVTAENLAKQYHLSREEQDCFALASHRKAAAAWARGFFDDEVFPIEIPQRKCVPILFGRDECVRADASVEGMARLKPILLDGTVTAGNASPMNDGASAFLLMSKERASESSLEPLARITGFASAGVDPNIMGIGPVVSTRKLMKQMGLTIDDFDIVELNEAFASQSLACIRELNIDMDRVNPNGGAIAIGHPNAASGGILMCRTVRHMKQQNLKRGLISFCCGGGQGFSLVVERD